jgi:cytochrome c biogenesis protein CcmG/thiol:disulfide interchange protein DsbE
MYWDEMMTENQPGAVDQTASGSVAEKHNRNQFNPVLLLFILPALFGIVAAVAISTQGNRNASSPDPAVIGYTPLVSLVGSTAPDFTLKTLDGDAIQLSSLRGQWVFLNFWATWCTPCRQEMPTFRQMLDGDFGAAKGKVTVLAVDSDGQDTPGKMQAFFADIKVSIPAAHDPGAAVGRQYAVIKLPTTYIIDPTGVIRYQQFGEITPDLMRKYLDEMLKPSS